jgi:hypothetical protein
MGEDISAPAKVRRKIPPKRMRVKDARGRFIAVRCSENEHAAISEKAAQAGFSVGAFLRNLALGDAGPRAVRRPPVERKELSRLLGHLGKVGSNVNQLARGFNQTGVLPGFPELLTARDDIRAMRDALMKALGRGH